MSYLPKAYKRPGPLRLVSLGVNTYQHIVEGDVKKFSQDIYLDEKALSDDIRKWLEANVGKQFTSASPLQYADWDYRNLYVVNVDRPMTGNSHRLAVFFSFKDKSKAALFKLWWGK